MTRLIGLGLLLALAGCEKEHAPTRPAGEQQGEAKPEPPVIVEQPGATPDSSGEPSESTGSEEATKVVATEVPCQTDADCVPDSCCHATSCVAVADAPDCSQAVCTMDCRAETMDCYGGCLCQAGRCAAQLWSPSASG